MERQQNVMISWLQPKPLWILLMFASLIVHSLAQTSLACPTTGEEVPKFTPRMDFGSFESIPHPSTELKRDIFIYWDTKDLNICGDSIEYQAYYELMTKTNEIRLIKSNNTYYNRAEFVGLRSNVGYIFRVYLANKYGRSTVYTSLYVPHESEKWYLNSMYLKKTLADVNTAIEISWIYKGSFGDKISNFTLFWCENDDKDFSPYQCTGDLNWTFLRKSEFRYKFKVPNLMKTYSFAISANGFNLLNLKSDKKVFISSGMVWALCDYLDFNEPVSIVKLWASYIDEYSLGVRWKLDCIDKINLITDFIVHYCPIDYVKFIGSRMECYETANNQMEFQNENNMKAHFAYIDYLDPNTTYVITITALTTSNIPFNSSPLVVTTLKETVEI